MCGLVGVISTSSHATNLKAFLAMLRFDYVRGAHSTGVIANTKDGIIWTYKALGMPENLIEEYGKEWEDSSILMGHNRYATEGGINVENAHPFMHGDWVGSHNGTLISRYGLEGSPKDFEVDSSQLIYTISKLGVKETLKDVNGAFALTLYNTETDEVVIVRNSERTLFYMMLDKGTMLYASSEWMLEGAKEALGKWYRSGAGDILPFKVGTIYTIDHSGSTLEVKEEEVELYTPSFSYNYNTYYPSYHNNGESIPATECIGKVKEIIPSGNNFTAVFTDVLVEATGEDFPFDVRMYLGNLAIPNLGDVFTFKTGAMWKSSSYVYSSNFTADKCKEKDYNKVKAKKTVGRVMPRLFKECMVNPEFIKATAEKIYSLFGVCDCCGDLIDAGSEDAILIEEKNPELLAQLTSYDEYQESFLFCSDKCLGEYK